MTDRFFRFAALVLPAVNLGVWAAFNFGGGAHGHGPQYVAAIAGAELVAIGWFCARRTDRPLLPWTLVGLLVDAVASVAAIYVFIFVFLVIAYAGKGGGD